MLEELNIDQRTKPVRAIGQRAKPGQRAKRGQRAIGQRAKHKRV